MFHDDIKEAQCGDITALNRLIERHKMVAFSVALKYVKNEVAAQDVVQEAFIKIFINIKKFRNESNFSTWLYRIVFNEALQYLKKEKAKFSIILGQQEELNASAISEIFPEERSEIIKVAMECLTSKEYMIITLFYLSEKTIKEIEIITNESKGNIKVILHRARKKLEEFFDNHKELKEKL